MKVWLIRVCYLLFTTSLIVLAAVLLQLNHIHEEFEVLAENELALNRLGGKVIHLDEVLTMSTHMAAATGDIAWEDRYYENVALLDTVLGQVSKLAPNVYESDANRITESANAELVRMEMKAFDHVRVGFPDSAKLIINGAEYQDQKRIYSEGIQHLLFGIDLSVVNKLKSYGRLMKTMLYSLVISIVLLVVDWILILRISKLE